MYDFSKQDPEIWNAMQQETSRQENVIELIASENIASPAVRAVQSSALTNKYAVGYPGKRVYTGNEAIDKIYNITRDRTKSDHDVTMFDFRVSNQILESLHDFRDTGFIIGTQ